MISLPDELLDSVDAEARRRRTTRSGLLQEAARRELGLTRRDPAAIRADLDAFSRTWTGSVDAAALVRAERLRDR